VFSTWVKFILVLSHFIKKETLKVTAEHDTSGETPGKTIETISLNNIWGKLYDHSSLSEGHNIYIYGGFIPVRPPNNPMANKNIYVLDTSKSEWNLLWI